MSMGIKETKELIAGMGEAAVTLKKLVDVFNKAKENGFGAEDLVLLSSLIAAAPDTSKITAAIDDVDKVKDELKDLDKSEVLEIIADLYAQADRVNQA